MHDRKLFLSLLSYLHKKLAVRHFSRQLTYGLATAACAGAVLAIAGRLFIITFLWEKIVAITALLIISFAVWAFLKRPNRRDAAQHYDEYAGEEAVSTALSGLDKEDVMLQLQRKDALRRMKESRKKVEQIKALNLPSKPLYTALFLVLLTSFSLAFPSTMMEQAEQKEEEKRIMKETREKVEKLAEKKKDNGEKVNKELTELQKELAESKTAEESLKKLLEKERKTAQLKKEAEEAEKKLNSLSEKAAGNNLNELSKALQNMNQKKLEEAMKQLKDKQSLSKEELAGLQMLQDSMDGEGKELNQLTEEQLQEMLANLEKSLQEAMAAASSLSQTAAAQQDLQQLANNLNQQMAAADLGAAQSLAFNNSSSNPASSGQNPPGGKGSNPSQSGNSQGSGNSSSGNGSGSGSGSGSGTGSGTGSGNGSGQGGGNGAGSGQGSRELVTVPDRLGGKTNQSVDNGQLGQGSGERQTTDEGPALRGSARPYNEVYGEYEQAYRESVDRMALPSNLENVVKNYFSELNPEGE
ncbi:hypothetical protein FZC84_00180 [Rossellomorea vietnamensis]|uniref:Uncharacterized protein n=1 Tax=Rossellomorea vietnamensis TaxID=218284 RepID=A0A5D4MIG4_9BACI|nr:hypothetical protein [Rossellomorea vietnamensis]TYS01124.1 hypothetical protein FZC84_00180 [Rossellomorea vietnamensis]